MSQQGLVQASIRAITGTAESWEGDWHALFTLAGIPTGEFNGRLLRWINLQLSAAYTNLPEAQQAYATAQAAYNWSSMGSIFTPLALGSLIYELIDFERADKLSLTGSAIDSVTGLVTGSLYAQSVAGSKPAWSATGFHGRPVATLDGTADELTLGSVPFPTGATACEIWLVVDQTALVADTADRRIFAYGAAGTVSRTIQRSVQAGVNRAVALIGNGTITDSSSNTTVDFSGRHVVRARIGATQTIIDVDGIAGSPVNIVPATDPTRVRLGASSATSAALFFQGGMNAAAVTAPLSAAQSAQMYGYFNPRL